MTGEELKISLLSLDETLANVARKLDMTPQNLDGILKTKDIKTGLIERLCKVYHISSTFFFNESRGGVTVSATDNSQAAGRDLHVAPEDALMAERVKYLEAIVKEKDERISELKERIEDLKNK
ncbi:MAG: hypothetical protein K2L11_11700 [Muribaculaceae bacterium]|nr:hypothetical protein [Muribaculaceae bacterium]